MTPFWNRKKPDNTESALQVKQSAELIKPEFELLSFSELHRLYDAAKRCSITWGEIPVSDDSSWSLLWKRARFQDDYFAQLPQIITGDNLVDILRNAYHPEDFEPIELLLSSINKQLGVSPEYEYRLFGKDSAGSTSTSHDADSLAMFKIKDLDIKSENLSQSDYDIQVLIRIPKMGINPKHGCQPATPVPCTYYETGLSIRSRDSGSYYNFLSGGSGSVNWETFLLTEDGMRLEVFAEEYGVGNITKGSHADVYFHRLLKPEDVSSVNLKDAVNRAHMVLKFLDDYFRIKKQLIRDQMPIEEPNILAYIESNKLLN